MRFCSNVSILFKEAPFLERFGRENVPVALELAQRLGCTRLNALVGQESAGMSREEQLELARENMAWAAHQAAEYGLLTG